MTGKWDSLHGYSTEVMSGMFTGQVYEWDSSGYKSYMDELDVKAALGQDQCKTHQLTFPGSRGKAHSNAGRLNHMQEMQ